jgi:hypothetical protein
MTHLARHCEERSDVAIQWALRHHSLLQLLLVDQGLQRYSCGTIFNSSLQPKAWAYLRKVVNDGG